MVRLHARRLGRDSNYSRMTECRDSGKGVTRLPVSNTNISDHPIKNDEELKLSEGANKKNLRTLNERR